MPRPIKAVTYIVAALSISALTSQATVTFSDSTFSPTDWTAVKIVDTTPSGTDSFSISQQSSGGNPTFYQQAILSMTAQGLADGASLFTASVYNPAVSGAINSVSYSFDRELISRVGGSPDPFFGLLVFQAGTYYDTALTDSANTTWMNLSGSALTANNFSKVSGPGPSLPDFSATGAPITFGYLDASGIGPGNVTITNGVDNYSVTISNVPEPGTWAIGALATALLAFQLIRAAAFSRRHTFTEGNEAD